MPRDLIAVLAVLFATFSLQFFESTAVLPALLRLTPAVFRGFVWQIFTYPFVGWGGSGLWFLLELLILFWFGRDVFWRLGRQRFWLLVARAAIGAAVVAVLVQLVQTLAGGGASAFATFSIMQGQRILMAIVIAAFATFWGEATILLFFVIPVKARWFLWLEILFAFIAFLRRQGLRGFLRHLRRGLPDLQRAPTRWCRPRVPQLAQTGRGLHPPPQGSTASNASGSSTSSRAMAARTITSIKKTRAEPGFFWFVRF